MGHERGRSRPQPWANRKSEERRTGGRTRNRPRGCPLRLVRVATPGVRKTSDSERISTTERQQRGRLHGRAVGSFESSRFARDGRRPVCTARARAARIRQVRGPGAAGSVPDARPRDRAVRSTCRRRTLRPRPLKGHSRRCRPGWSHWPAARRIGFVQPLAAIPDGHLGMVHGLATSGPCSTGPTGRGIDSVRVEVRIRPGSEPRRRQGRRPVYGRRQHRRRVGLRRRDDGPRQPDRQRPLARQSGRR